MKLNQFEQLVLYCFACLLSDSHPHVSGFVMMCVANKEIKGDIKDEIYDYYDKNYKTGQG